jgi:hypothetical protein
LRRQAGAHRRQIEQIFSASTQREAAAYRASESNDSTARAQRSEFVRRPLVDDHATFELPAGEWWIAIEQYPGLIVNARRVVVRADARDTLHFGLRSP